jgi:hypothetical protein
VAVILPAKGHLAVSEGDQPLVGNGHAMRVTPTNQAGCQ